MQLHEIILYFLLYCLGLLIAGLVYREIWHIGLKRGKFQKGFDELLDKSKVMGKIDNIETQINDPDFSKKVGKQIWQQNRAEYGGTMKGVMAEQKEMMQDLGELGSFKYQSLLQLTKELDGLIQAGLIRPSWGEKFLKWAQIPRAQPFLDGLAKDLFETLDGKGHGSGESWEKYTR